MNKIYILVLIIAFSSYANALDCSTITNSEPNSDASKCLCKIGFYGDSSSSLSLCTACTQSTTQANGAVGLEQCNICTQGYFLSKVAVSNSAASGTASNATSAVCSKCDGQSTTGGLTTVNAGSAADCKFCIATYYISKAAVTTAGSQAAVVCTACPANTITNTVNTPDMSDITVCKCADTNAAALSATVAACACNVGFSGFATTAAPCVICAANSTSLKGEACTACPTGETALAGAACTKTAEASTVKLLVALSSFVLYILI